jgi:peptide-methionine (S)-S-oxide reductase
MNLRAFRAAGRAGLARRLARFLGLCGLVAAPACALGTETHPATHPMTAEGLVLVPGIQRLPSTVEHAAFAAGCFWGVEDAFRKQPGVVATAAGFMGGHTANPTYRQVCTEGTGHAETVELAFDPSVVSYAQLLDLFWHLHDPTTLNRQGPDVGDQYRSVIFTFGPSQAAAAAATRDQLQASGELRDPIVTEIVPAGTFTKAEEYHQQYVEKGGVAFCHVRRHGGQTASQVR